MHKLTNYIIKISQSRWITTFQLFKSVYKKSLSVSQNTVNSCSPRLNKTETWQSLYKIINFLLLCCRHSSDKDEEWWRHHTSFSCWYLCILFMMGCIQCLHWVAPSKTFFWNLFIVRQRKSYIFASVVTNDFVLLK